MLKMVKFGRGNWKKEGSSLKNFKRGGTELKEVSRGVR